MFDDFRGCTDNLKLILVEGRLTISAQFLLAEAFLEFWKEAEAIDAQNSFPPAQPEQQQSFDTDDPDTIPSG